ncbi:hypothetical protein [Streptomyces thermolilacinus]|uniref:hypothetical protein n=1 Tax=Streptomyces thermolilacinus TaxID=285540 RepID=UPI00040BC184|nr:hypothetical protein [Streptomyces thermolilacinus]
MDKLVDDGLAEEADGLIYLHRHLAADESIRPYPERLQQGSMTFFHGAFGVADLPQEKWRPKAAAMAGVTVVVSDPRGRVLLGWNPSRNV